MCHAVWRNYIYAHDTLLRIIRSVCLCVQYNCSPGPPYHCRKVGGDLEDVPSNAWMLLGAGHTYSTAHAEPNCESRGPCAHESRGESSTVYSRVLMHSWTRTRIPRVKTRALALETSRTYPYKGVGSVWLYPAQLVLLVTPKTRATKLPYISPSSQPIDYKWTPPNDTCPKSHFKSPITP